MTRIGTLKEVLLNSIADLVSIGGSVSVDIAYIKDPNNFFES